MDNLLLTYIFLGLLLFLAVFVYAKYFTVPKVGALALVTGGVKMGKSTFAVRMCFKSYKKALRRWKIRKYFQNKFGVPVDEMPLLYSNVPLLVPYVPLTLDLLQRKARFRYKSVIYVCEASLVADSMMFKDMELNERLQYFNKLIGHETKGGLLFYDTQALGDLHFSIKRCVSNYFYVHDMIKWIPFILIARVREERYSDDGSVVAVDNTDGEDVYRLVVIPKSTWKLFDCYCYSYLTDDLPVVDNVVQTKYLKAHNVLSFRGYYDGVKTTKKEVDNIECLEHASGFAPVMS